MAMTMTREEVGSQCGWETLCFTIAVQLFAWQRMGVAGLITLRAGNLATERQRLNVHLGTIPLGLVVSWCTRVLKSAATAASERLCAVSVCMARNVSAGQNNCPVPPQHRHPEPGAIGTSAGGGEGEHEIAGSLMRD